MAGDEIADRQPQRSDVQRSRHPKHRGNVVGGRGGIELIDEPHPCLGERQRHPGRSRHHRHHRAESRVGAGHPLGEAAYRGCLEQVAQVQVDTHVVADAGDDARRQQRVAAHVEHGLDDADLLQPQYLGEDLRQRGLGIGCGCDEFDR